METESRWHEMPFGTALTETGVRFRLWAPDAAGVELVLEDRREPLPMRALPGGWFERIESNAGPGSDYRFRIDGGDLLVPDPASRHNPNDVHGPSRVFDPGDFPWRDGEWKGRSWDEAVIYELHVGTFTPEGSFRAAAEKLEYLARLGITAIELMPVAEFPGRRNWGYDGVLLFAPEAEYGTPDDLKAFVQAAHLQGLMVLLDVVYNHFGPEGNYLHLYARRFFSDRHETPWGAGINFDGEDSAVVRDFFIHNALYWLEEFRFDGLRLDAVHAIADDSTPSFLEELAARVRRGPGRQRHIHLVLENDANRASLLRRGPDGKAVAYDAQWNDDIHHVLHHLLSGETDGYYADYRHTPVEQSGRGLAEGFIYQGKASAYRGGEKRGEASHALPPSAFVAFLQNHDQVGNRAFGERLSRIASPRALRAALTLILLAPSPPLLFMGEEFACPTPFLYFCDFDEPLASAVRDGRRGEFDRFARFSTPDARETIPDPTRPSTFEASKLRWNVIDEPPHRDCLDFYRNLLDLRRRVIVPRLNRLLAGASRYRTQSTGGLAVQWPLRGGAELRVMTNLGPEPMAILPPPTDAFAFSSPDVEEAMTRGTLPGWSTVWWVVPEGRNDEA